MTTSDFFPEWRELIRYSAPGPQPVLLRDDPGFRALLIGLEPGSGIPQHPGRQALYHVLEGSGAMTVDGERYPLRAGVTVIASEGSSRGIEAEARLAILAVRVGPEPDTAG